MIRYALSVILITLLCCTGVSAAEKVLDRATMKESIREILKDNPDMIFDAFQGHEDRLYDLIQIGLEKKNKDRIRAERLVQLQNPKIAAPHPERPIWGNPDGDISIIVFSDFQSATCSKADKIISELLDKHPEISYRFRHNPLNIHKQSLPAAYYYEAMALQDKRKAMRFNHLILENRLKIKKGGTAELDLLAASCGADMERLHREISSGAVKSIVDADIKEAKKIGFTASPVFLVNGVTVTGAAPVEEFEEVIRMINDRR
ncbi:DsbA family protein [Maridesulfovibrio sp. FT414]|uniref:DsbA family protein n=1 Tax=Maridesulfovibrio sp. FT414 TaxID=2979469 RepID=UPI003D806A2C